ncbi:MAG: helix-turn-helix domain-containing protein [Euryarchaeota archaeon]|jgi:DNA-binding transcriptional ArsR family regulator|nr:helix-turn-helix domain-containing protein [Euryarchaeota archaeon]MBT3970609.1 helix-turn-helix domain-containing protein [Euryarchaeota archaeon]MBT4408081.1 helix-turn-helix domain-containing protein [Euryarchaeota archaeon]
MSKIRGDPRLIALAHPTRHDLYAELSKEDELATVALEKKLNVTRYHLYHHLGQMVKAGLIENHRDEGRARWWRILSKVDGEIPSPQKTQSPSGSQTAPSWAENIPAEMVALLESGAKFEFVPLNSTDASDIVNTRKAIENIARHHGVDISLPFTFVPGGLLLLTKSR